MNIFFLRSKECGKLIRAMIKAGENGSIWVVEGTEIYKVCLPDWQSYKPKNEEKGLKILEIQDKLLKNTAILRPYNEYPNKPTESCFQINGASSKSIRIHQKLRNKLDTFEEFKAKFETSIVRHEQDYEIKNGSYKTKKKLGISQEEVSKFEDSTENAVLKVGEDPSKVINDPYKKDKSQPKPEKKPEEQLYKIDEVPCKPGDDPFILNYVWLTKKESIKIADDSNKFEVDTTKLKKQIFRDKNDTSDVKNEQRNITTDPGESGDDNLKLIEGDSKVKDDQGKPKGHMSESDSCKSNGNSEKSRKQTLKTKDDLGMDEWLVSKSNNDSNQTKSKFNQIEQDSCKHKDALTDDTVICQYKSDSSKSKLDFCQSKRDECKTNDGSTKPVKSTKEENTQKKDIYETKYGPCEPKEDPWKTEDAADKPENWFKKEPYKSTEDPYEANDDPYKTKDNICKPKEDPNKPETRSIDLKEDPHKRKIYFSRTEEDPCTPNEDKNTSQEISSKAKDAVSELKKVRGNRRMNNPKVRTYQRNRSKSALKYKYKRTKL